MGHVQNKSQKLDLILLFVINTKVFSARSLFAAVVQLLLPHSRENLRLYNPSLTFFIAQYLYKRRNFWNPRMSRPLPANYTQKHRHQLLLFFTVG
jgi:hypothetical protein